MSSGSVDPKESQVSQTTFPTSSRALGAWAHLAPNQKHLDKAHSVYRTGSGRLRVHLEPTEGTNVVILLRTKKRAHPNPPKKKGLIFLAVKQAKKSERNFHWRKNAHLSSSRRSKQNNPVAKNNEKHIFWHFSFVFGWRTQNQCQEAQHA